MFSGFRVDLSQKFFREDYHKYLSIGSEHLTECRKKYDEKLQKYEHEKVISAEQVAMDWFPEMNVDVFISHSRLDKNVALAFAGWLSANFDLRCFLDSNVWNHVNNLVSALGKKLRFSQMSSFQSAGQVYGHSYMLLAMALLKMIDKSEAVFLLNGGSALPKPDVTYSPWIFAEIVCTNLIRKKPLLAYRKYDSSRLCENYEKMQAVLEFLTVAYEVNLDHLTRLNPSILEDWKDRYQRNKDMYDPYPLDALYEITKYKDRLCATRNFAEMNSSEAILLNEIWTKESFEDEALDRVAMILESTDIMNEAKCYLRMCRKNGACPCPWCEKNLLERGL